METSAPDLVMNASVVPALVQTLVLLLAGFVPAAVSGLVLGTLLGLNRWTAGAAKYLLQVPASLPAVLLIPILLILLKQTEPIGSLLVAFSTFWVVAIYTAIGIQRARRHQNQMFFAIPSIFQGLRFGLMLAWSVMITADILLSSNQTLGGYIWDLYNQGTQSLKPVVNAAIAVMVTAFLMDQILNFVGFLIQKRLKPKATEDVKTTSDLSE